LQLKPKEYDAAVQKGMVYGIHVPVTRPGPYVVRAAVRDAATEGSGSAQQYVEVPDVDNGRLALSGIVLLEAAAEASEDPHQSSSPQGSSPGEDVTSGAARRSFRPGAHLVYGYEIINAAHPELEAQIRIYREGQQVVASKTTLSAAAGAAGQQRLRAEGRLSMGRDMTPGEYVLQVIVTDRLVKGKFNTVTQSMDFEIEP